MSRRTIIITDLIKYIQAETGSTGHRGLRFLHEITNFPSFYVHATAERRQHVGAGVIYGVLSMAIRGYAWSDNIDDVDTYCREIETAVQTFRDANRQIIEDVYVNSVSTDEGLLEPYGVVDLQVDIIYDAQDGTNQPIQIINYELQDSVGNSLTSPDGLSLQLPLEFK